MRLRGPSYNTQHQHALPSSTCTMRGEILVLESQRNIYLPLHQSEEGSALEPLSYIFRA